jgi:2-dehydro-3-deoxyphosphogluconate aldolase/(4S)-4-hydroxy-2-oxoglutarate aldolase
MSTTMNQPVSVAPLPPFRSRVVPVVVVEDAAHAVPMARALLAGGIDVMEITLRSSAALVALAAVVREVPGMHVGAGTVTRPHELTQVQAAGATFALSPGCTPSLLAAAQAAGLPFIPGVATASEAMLARDAGYTLLKCFPAGVLGGPDLLKAWAGPLPELRFCPTGGVSVGNLASYLSLPNVAMVGGSWLTPADTVRRGDWGSIEQLARQATQASQAVEQAA